ncbi:MAG TPA: GNAT family N-acetyltransferase [Agriterribacter sp.]|nr:GNAT family N-acetyltransferase [Agriterribacter sp.]
MLHFRKAGIGDIEIIRELTYKIWPQTYAHILTDTQIAYMLDMMYSAPSLEKQMNTQKHRFIVGYDDAEPVAFASYSSTKNKEVYRLHKIYVLQNQQGKGIGKKMIDYIVEDINTVEPFRLELNVNRYNKAMEFYVKLGFLVMRQEDIDIGNGFFMNDFVMQKVIGRKSVTYQDDQQK